MKKTITLLFIALLFSSCSKDKNDDDSHGEYNITGTFVTPNGLDAVSKARVNLYKDGELISTGITDSQGAFVLDNLNQDQYDLTISKGKFRTSKSIDLSGLIDAFTFDLDSLPIKELPSIAVVTGYFDHIEEVLYNLGLMDAETGEPLFDIIDGHDTVDRNYDHNHSHSTLSESRVNPNILPNVDFGFGEFIENPDLLDNYDIIFLNCGLSESKIGFSNNLTDYVNNGGLLYATDYAFVYLNDITANGTQYLSFMEPFRRGDSLETVAQIFNQDLLDWILMNFDIDIPNGTVNIDEFLGGWQAVDTYDSQTVLPWLYGPLEYNGVMEDKYLAYTFLHGYGGVFYSSFHTENNTTDATTVERLMQYMVFELASMKREID